jgi:hypothetical protein
MVVTPSSGETLAKDEAFKHSGQRGVNQPIEIVEGPHFRGDFENLTSTTENQFLDILVGSEDHKTLITKETEAGIITSAILPPWYVNDTSSPTPPEIRNFTATVTIDESEEPLNSSGSSHSLHAVQDMGQMFLNLFTGSASDSYYPQRPTFSNSHVVKDLQTQESGRLSFKDLLKELSPVFPSSSSAPSLITDTVNGFHYGSNDGKTNVYGYYPEDHAPEGHDHDNFDDREDEAENEEIEGSPSHVIDIAYDPKTRPEIVIEPEATQEYNYGEFSHDREPLSAGSELRPQVLPPPPKFQHQPVTTPDLEQEEPTQYSGSQDNQLIAPVQNGSEENQQNPNQSNEHGHDHGETQIVPAQMQTHEQEPNAAEEEENFHDNRESSNERLNYEDYEQEPPLNPVDRDGNPNDHDNNPNANNVFERQPVRQLDRTLYRQSQVPSPEKDRATSQEGETPEITTKRVHEVYAVSYTTPESSTFEQPQNQNHNASGFVAPEPINFHSNVYSFKPSVSSGGFLPAGGDSWRPVVYDSEESQNQNQNQYSGPGRFQAPESNPLPMRPSLQYPHPPANNRDSSPFTTPLAQQGEEGASSNSNSLRQENPKAVWTDSPMQIKPSQPIPPPPSPSPGPQRLKFPEHDPNASAAALIDRNKYLYRPAPPPIVMRRTPQQSMPYLPNRRKTAPTFPRVPPQYLNPHQQIQQQQLLKQRLFQQHLARIRKRGNVHWPNEHQQQHSMDHRMKHFPPQPNTRRNG